MIGNDSPVKVLEFGSHARHERDKWFVESAHVEPMLEGLRKAGMKFTEGA